MTCGHLRAVEKAIRDRGFRELSRDTDWGEPCHEWVYFECYIGLAAARAKFAFDPCVKDHIHRGTHEGSEQGLYCEQCHDGVMGLPEESLRNFVEQPSSNEELFARRYLGVQPRSDQSCPVFPA